MVDIFIMRIGDPSKNFHNSVISRVNNHNPIWGYNSEKCCGFKAVSNNMHRNIVSSIDENGFMYVLFKPYKCKDFIGLAKVSNVYERITRNNTYNGWTEPTAYGSLEWNYQFDIDVYYDLTIVANRAFKNSTLNEFIRLTQSSVHRINNTSELYGHMMKHINIVIEYFYPTFTVE